MGGPMRTLLLALALVGSTSLAQDAEEEAPLAIPADGTPPTGSQAQPPPPPAPPAPPATPPPAWPQPEPKVEIHLFGGFQWGGVAEDGTGYWRAKDNADYGIGLGYRVARNVMVELQYFRSDTRLLYRPVKAVPYVDAGGLGLGYLQAGVVGDFAVVDLDNGGTFRPFTTASLGAVYYVLKDEDEPSHWLFAVNAGVGARVFFNRTIGLRLQSRLLLPLNFTGAGLWCGFGGCDIGVTSRAPFVQGDVSLGLVLAF